MVDESRDRPLVVLSALIRALTHKIRTPLSVISNDLYYLKTLVPPGEAMRTGEQCKIIAEILTSLAIPDAEAKERVCLSTLLPDTELPRAETNTEILCSPKQIRSAIVGTNEFLLTLGKVDTNFKISEKEARIIFTTTKNLGFEKTFQSLTEFNEASLKSDSPTPPLVDALVWANDGTVEVRCGDTVSAAFCFKY